MSTEVTRGEIIDIIANFALKNPEYRQALIDNPREVLSRQLNQQIPAALHVRVLQETSNTVYLISPYVPMEGDELSDADLERIAGGKGSKGDRSENNNRVTCNNTPGVGTRVEIAGL